MDKTTLRNTLSALTPSHTVSVLFRGRPLQGFTVTGTRRGRGKGGPPIVTLTADDGSTQELTSSMNEEVLMMVLPTGTVGSENPSDSPRTFAVNNLRAAEFKALLTDKGVVGTVGSVVQLSSLPEAPEFTGIFAVEQAAKVRGCHGQVRLTLRSLDNETAPLVEFYTHRHSGVVTSLEVLSVCGNAPAPASTTEVQRSEEGPQDTVSSTEAEPQDTTEAVASLADVATMNGFSPGVESEETESTTEAMVDDPETL